MAFSNAKQHIPELFRLIMERDDERKQFIARAVVDLDTYKAYLKDRRSLSGDAEVALRRSPDNANRAR